MLAPCTRQQESVRLDRAFNLPDEEKPRLLPVLQVRRVVLGHAPQGATCDHGCVDERCYAAAGGLRQQKRGDRSVRTATQQERLS